MRALQNYPTLAELKPSSRSAKRADRVRCSGFTLVEMLAVMGVIVVLLVLIAPAFNSIKGSQDVTKSAYDISGVLENARTYAIANNTYVWVGFFEENGSQPSTTPATAGVGRLVMAVVASKDGTRYSDDQIDSSNPPAFGTESPSASPLRNQVALALLMPLVKLDNTHLGTLNDGLNSGSTNNPVRPPVLTAYQVGDTSFASHSVSTGGSVINPTVFTYPLAVYGTTQTAQYTFTKIIEFSPRGEVSKIVENTFSGSGPQKELEIALQPTYGTAIDSRYTGTNSMKAAAAVQIEGITGQTKIYRL